MAPILDERDEVEDLVLELMNASGLAEHVVRRVIAESSGEGADG